MDFSKMRHRIVFLRPHPEADTNEFGELVPKWKMFKPTNVNLADGPEVMCDDVGNITITDVTASKKYEVWAHVAPATGREYEEAQKLREETTYKISTRYFGGITAEMKIYFRGTILDIVSVLNIDSRDEALEIIAKERDRYGKETD